jgi:hypothetical protein
MNLTPDFTIKYLAFYLDFSHLWNQGKNLDRERTERFLVKLAIFPPCSSLYFKPAQGSENICINLHNHREGPSGISWLIWLQAPGGPRSWAGKHENTKTITTCKRRQSRWWEEIRIRAGAAGNLSSWQSVASGIQWAWWDPDWLPLYQVTQLQSWSQVMHPDS